MKKTFEQITSDLIFRDENIIGMSWDVETYIQYEIDYQKKNTPEEEMENLEDNLSLFTELLEDLKDHDGLVYVSYHPMGAYFVEDLVTASGEDVF